MLFFHVEKLLEEMADGYATCD